MRKLFASRPTTKFDVIMAIAAAATAVWKASDTIKDYRSAQEEKELEK